MPHWITIVLKIAVTTLILTLFVRQLDIRSATHSLSTISPYAIFAAFAAVLAMSLAAAGRLVLVVAWFGPRFRLSDSCRVTLESMFFSQTFISFLGGDALRIWRVRQVGLALSKATSAVVLDRVIGTLVNHVFLLATVPWFLSSDASRSVKVIMIVLAAAGVAGFALILLLGYMHGRLGILDRLSPRIRTSIVRIASMVEDLLAVSQRRFAWIFVLSSLITIGNMLTFGFILTGMGVVFPLVVGCALLVPAVIEITMLPISLAGWGVREGAAVVAFGALGLPVDQALGASIAFGLTVAAVSMLGGALWLIDRREVKQI